MFLKIKCLACCSNVWAWVLLLIVCLSAALHGILAFLFADICYEFDLHLAMYYLPEADGFDGYENLNFLPPEASKFCGPDGSLAFMSDQFDAQLDASIQMAFDTVEEQCNDVVMLAFMDCSDVSILHECTSIANPCEERDGVLPTVGYQSKRVACEDDADDDEDCGWGFWNNELATVPTTVKIRNADRDNMPPEIVSCLYLRGEITNATNDEIATCFEDNEPCGGTCGWLTFEECATSCTNEQARENSATVVGGINNSTGMVARLRNLLDEQATPLLKCAFVSEMFADLFVPLCVDAFGGFSLISGANVVSIIALVISFPVGVMATKRLVKPKVSPETSYSGNTDGPNATANTQPPSNDPTAVEVTPLM